MHADFIAEEKAKQRKIESKTVYFIAGKGHRCVCTYATNSGEYDITLRRSKIV